MYYDRDALYGDGASIFFDERVNVRFSGKHGIYMAYNDTPSVELWGDSVVSCYAHQTEDDKDLQALVCGDLTIKERGHLICETAFNGQTLSTWGSGFPNTYYDIKILKIGEYSSSAWTSTPKEPYTPESGINVTGGVNESECRYISIKGIKSLVTKIGFFYDTYTVTPEKNNVTVRPYLQPSGAAELYNDLTWTCSDTSVLKITKTGKTGVILTGRKDGTATVTAKAPGGVTGSFTVVVSGFGDTARIDEVYVTGFSVPQVGQTVAENLSALKVSGEASCTIDSNTGWFNCTDFANMSASDVFVKGKTYYLKLQFKPAGGYRFDEDWAPILYLNGSTQYVDNAYARVTDGKAMCFTINLTPVVRIDEVNITGYKRPTAGQTLADYTATLGVPDGAGYNAGLLICWHYDGTGSSQSMNSTDVFEADETYYLTIYLVPAGGYCFDKDHNPTVLLGGSTEDVYTAGTFVNNNGYLIFHTVDFTVGSTTRIDEVNITGYKRPTVGQTVAEHLATLGVPAGAGYYIDFVKYRHYDGTDMPEIMEETDVFKAGETYYLEFRLIAENGYCFDEENEPTPLLGGSAGDVDPTWAYVQDDDLYKLCTVDFTVTAFTYGDVNDDGLINKKDSLALKKYLSDTSNPIDLAAADVFYDGVVNKKDSLRLKQYLAGFDVVLGA